MLVIPAKLQAAYLAFSFVFQQALQLARPIWTSLATLMPSSTQENRYAWTAQSEGMRKWVGPRLIRSLAQRVHPVANEPYEGTLGMDLIALETDQLGVNAPVIAQWAAAVAMWQDDLVIDAIRQGYTRLCYDGQPMYDTSHPLDVDRPALNTFSNYYPGTPLTAANFDYVYSQMAIRKGEAQRELQTVPTHIIVPPQLAQTAKQILKSDNIASVFANATGSGTQTNTLKGLVDIIVAPRLAGDPGKWYLAVLDGPVRPWLMQQVYAPRLVTKSSPTDDNVFHNRQVLIGADAYGAANYTLPHLVSAASA